MLQGDDEIMFQTAIARIMKEYDDEYVYLAFVLTV